MKQIRLVQNDCLASQFTLCAMLLRKKMDVTSKNAIQI